MRGKFFASRKLLGLLLTISTHTNHPQKMFGQLEFEFRSHRILYRFQLRRIEFNDLSAFRANHVIVVGVFIIVLVMRATIAEPHLAVLVQADRVRPAKHAARDRPHHLFYLVVTALFKQVAQALGVGETDVMTSLEAGDLKGKKIGTQWRVTRAAVDAFMKS